MSNPITDILHDFAINLHPYATGKGQASDYSKYTDEALQALYEAVKGCVPEKVRYNDETVPKYLKPAIGENWQQALRHEQGFNDCCNEVLTNLSLLFGVPRADSSKQEEASDV